jgi:signal transduction histidine kinase
MREKEADDREQRQDARDETLVQRELAAAAQSERRLDLTQRDQQQARREVEQDQRRDEQNQRDVQQDQRRDEQNQRDVDQDQRRDEQNQRDVDQDERERLGEMLIGMLSHDLRNPLGTILMGSSLLMKAGTLSETDARTVARIARSADRMTRMIEQLLDLTRIRLGGGLTLKRQRMNMNHVAEEVVDELRLVHGRDILVTPLPARTAEGSWDRDRIAELLSNLVANAIQHSPAETPIVVTLRRADEQVSLEVHNDGPPIPADLLPVIFDPFRSGRTGNDGLGLGLYISKRVVEAHGGSMRVQSAEGDGTTFYVELPLGDVRAS